MRTTGGTISAQALVVATGYCHPRFRGLVGRFRMKDTLRHRDAQAARVRQRIRSRRWRGTPIGLITTCGGPPTDGCSSAAPTPRTARPKGPRRRIARARDRLTSYLAAIYPDLADEQPVYAWEGFFAETPDGLPYIGTHSRYPNHLFALGYGGNGMTASFLAATLLLRLYQGRDKGRNSTALGNLFAFERRRK